jgi:hypothetical protein
MSLEWIRRRFDVPARRSVRVRYTARCDGEELDGVIVSSKGGRLLVKFDGSKYTTPCHPKYRLTYYPTSKEDISRYGKEYSPYYSDNDDDY